jgi:hypothetical protein
MAGCGLGRKWIYCIVLLCCTVFSAMAQDGALNKKVSVTFKNEGLTRCLEIVQQRAGVTFFYNPVEVNGTTKKYTIGFENKTVKEIVTYLLQGSGLEFEAADNKKIVIRKAKVLKQEDKTATQHKWRTVSGTVKDAKKGTPINGAEILIQSTGNHLTTDASGKFLVLVKDTVDVLVVYFVGYATTHVKVGDNTTLNIKIAPDSKTLGGVTVEARRRVHGSLLAE